MIVDKRDPTKYLYVGKTVNPKTRWRLHRRHSKIMHNKLNVYLRTHCVDNFEMKIVEQWEIPNRDCPMLASREQYYQILHRPPLNTYSCSGIVAESDQDYFKQYKKQNRGVARAQNKRPVVCDCGITVTSQHLPRHKRTARHARKIRERLQI